MVNAYLEIAKAADKALKRMEEGILFHKFDRDLGDKQ
tara:strand:- start:51 stop:161 length:111 start_codon:yes stop_codon:yes gene_type:complete